MRKTLKNPVSLRELLTEAVKFRPSTPQEILEDMGLKWPEWISEPLCHKSRPLKIDRQRLLVGVDAPVWAQEMEFAKKDLLKRLAQAFPSLTLTEIRCQIVTRPLGSI